MSLLSYSVLCTLVTDRTWQTIKRFKEGEEAWLKREGQPNALVKIAKVVHGTTGGVTYKLNDKDGDPVEDGKAFKQEDLEKIKR